MDTIDYKYNEDEAIHGYNRKDILKVLHYAIIQLHVHDHYER